MAVPHGIDRSGAAGGTGAQGMSGSLNDLSDPNADRIVFWDDSAGDLDWLSLGTGLAITGTSIALHANLVAMLGLATTDGNFIVGDGSTWVVESGATARASLGIPAVQSPDAAGDFVIGETASNPISVPFVLAGHPLMNGKIALSVASSILTIALKGLNDSDPSASNPVFVRIAQGNPPDGTYSLRKVTAALSMTVSLGSTLGHSNGVASPVYIYAIDNAGAIELAAGNTFVDTPGVSSTTAEGGAGGADSASTLYSVTGRASVPIAPILRWKSTQTSAGVWASVTGEQQLYPFPWKTPTVQSFVSNATYTKPWDLLWIDAVVIGGGGGSGGHATTGASQGSAAGGGGGGGYSQKRIAAKSVLPTETVTIGAGGTAGGVGAVGGTGGTSSFGTHTSSTGGTGGSPGTASGGSQPDGQGGAGGGATGGDVLINGGAGGMGQAVIGTALNMGGFGGNSFFGGGARSEKATTTQSGIAGLVYGGGASGASAGQSQTQAAGSAGAGGIIVIKEFY